MTVFTTDYVIVKQGALITGDAMLWIKRILRTPLRFPQMNDRAWVKKLAFVLGNPICCPATTYHKAVLGEPFVRSEYSFALDWDNLVRLAEEPGRFICDERPLLYYRVMRMPPQRHVSGITAGLRRSGKCSAVSGRSRWRTLSWAFIRRLTESMSSSFRDGEIGTDQKEKCRDKDLLHGNW